MLTKRKNIRKKNPQFFFSKIQKTSGGMAQLKPQLKFERNPCNRLRDNGFHRRTTDEFRFHELINKERLWSYIPEIVDVYTIRNLHHMGDKLFSAVLLSTMCQDGSKHGTTSSNYDYCRTYYVHNKAKRFFLHEQLMCVA